jgi:hypothetical protein
MRNSEKAFEDGIDDDGHIKLVSWHQCVSFLSFLYICSL